MEKGRVSGQILLSIRENCQGDEIIASFLIKLLYEEANHPGQWKWRETYDKYLHDFVNRWEGEDEN